MIRHLIRLVWARKRSNALLILEIFISFLVVFSVSTMAVASWRRWQAPLGFTWDSVCLISASFADIDREQRRGTTSDRTEEILRELAALPEVEAVAATILAPFEAAEMTTAFEHEGRKASAAFTSLSDGGAEVLGLKVVQGRWFEAGDDAYDWMPVVINRLLADELFEDADPIGKTVSAEGDQRVVGVVEHFRRGELMSVRPTMIFRVSTTKPNRQRATRFLIRTNDAADADFEVRAQRVVKSVAPEWTVKLQPLHEVRRTGLRMALAPLVLAAMVAGSLMLMVALGMVGVFWQSVTGRTHEIGLRRAMGSTRAGVSMHFLAEVLVLATIAITGAVVVVLQLPLIGILKGVGWPTVLGGISVSAGLMYLLAAAAGLYPAWLAARVRPADALHDE